jgi:SAM-dependent methyltransferase
MIHPDYRAISFREEYRDRARGDLAELSGKTPALNAQIAKRIIASMAMRDGLTFLDIGCGSGEVLIEATAAAPFSKIIGILPTQEEAQRLSTALHGTGIAVRIADAAQTRLRSHSIQRIVCNSVLHMLPSPRKALLEIARIAAPDSIIFIGEVPWSDRHQHDRVKASPWRWLLSTLKWRPLALPEAIGWLLFKAITGHWNEIGPAKTFWSSSEDFTILAASCGLALTQVAKNEDWQRCDYWLTPITVQEKLI